MTNTGPINEDDLHAWADNRLDGVRRAEIEAWLLKHPEAQAEVDAWRMQNTALRKAFHSVLEEPVPSRLIYAVRTKGLWRPQFSLRGVAAAVVWLVVGGAIGYALRGYLPASEGGMALAREAAIAHAVFVPEVKHPVEVPAEQEAHLVQWLSKRLGTSLKIPQLNDAGYALVGGRLLPGEDDASGAGPVAQFMYQSGSGQRLTLYVRRNAAVQDYAGFRYVHEGKLDVFYWIDGGLGCALSGEIGKPELLRVASSIYHQLGFDGKPAS